MATLTIPNSFTANTTARSAEVNANFTAVATFLNSTKINDDNIQAAGISGTKFATSVVDDSTLQLSSGVLAVKDSGVTLAKLAAAVQAALVPAGTILPYGGTAAPTGYLMCDGASVSRTTYSALFTAISTAFGTASGSTFNVPKLQGAFLRGRDASAGVDPNAGTRTALQTGGATGDAVGSYQADAFQGHFHSAPADAVIYNATPNNFGEGTTSNSSHDASNSPTGAPVTDGTNGTPRTATETRPKNVAVNFIIKT